MTEAPVNNIPWVGIDTSSYRVRNSIDEPMREGHNLYDVSGWPWVAKQGDTAKAIAGPRYEYQLEYDALRALNLSQGIEFPKLRFFE